MIPVGKYRRVSEDKTLSGKASSWREVEEQVRIQDEAIMELATQLGVTVTRDYCDNDTVASNPFIVRNDFEQMLRDLEAGVIRGILFLHSDRLARLVYDAARVSRVFEMHEDYIGRSVEGGVDLSTVEGRGMFIMQATVGNMEIGNTKRRVTRTNKAIAEKGVMHGGPRAFGWNEDRRTLHPTEGQILRESILAIPGGLTVGEFKRKLLAAGYQAKENKRSRGGAKLQHSAAESILTSPRVCGYRFYIPEAARRSMGRPWLPDFIVYKDGRPVLGDWEAAASPDEWRAAVDTLKERKEKRKAGVKGAMHDTTAKYLLSGVARCGKCTSPMWSNPYTKGTPSYERWGFRYACLPSLGGCGGVTRVGPLIDELVEAAFLLETSRGLGDSVEKARDIDLTIHDARIQEIAEEIEEVNARRRAKRISMSVALDQIEDLEKERDELMTAKGKLALQQRKKAMLSPDALADWKDLTMVEKRTRLKESIRAVIVHPVGRGKPFDPDMIEIVWKKS